MLLVNKESFVAQNLSHATALLGIRQATAEALVQGLHISPFDTVVLDAASDGGIEAVRHFTRHLQLSPQFGAVRLGVIWQADLLTPQAQNALLKLLEEPPDCVKIILSIGQEAAMLPTVLSRCTRLTVKEEGEGGKLLPGSNALEQFLACEDTAKEAELRRKVEGQLLNTYHSWCQAGRPSAQLDELSRLWYVYGQLETQINKRLVLEEWVLSSGVVQNSHP